MRSESTQSHQFSCQAVAHSDRCPTLHRYEARTYHPRGSNRIGHSLGPGSPRDAGRGPRGALRRPDRPAERAGHAPGRAVSGRLRVQAYAGGSVQLEIAICDFKWRMGWTALVTKGIHRTWRGDAGECASESSRRRGEHPGGSRLCAPARSGDDARRVQPATGSSRAEVRRAVQGCVEAIRELMTPPAPARKRIGFHPEAGGQSS